MQLSRRRFGSPSSVFEAAQLCYLSVMDQNALYEDDVHAWAEHQGALLRRLAETRRDLPNDLDLNHIAEEIEDVGNAQRAAAKSLIRQILIHLIKLHLMPDSDAARHRRGEIVTFHADLQDRLDPSMRGRIGLNELWGRALREVQTGLKPEDLVTTGDEWTSLRKQGCPMGFADLKGAEFDVDTALAEMRRTG